MTPEKAQSQTQPYDAFRALPGPLAVRDVRDLMTYPFFSLAKSPRTAPIHFRTANVSVRVEGAAEQGLATIWDADLLIWAASQLIEARDSGLIPARRIVATPREILRFIGRGTSARDYLRLRAALERLKSTRVAACLRNASSQEPQCFSWISDWKEGLEVVVSDWFYDRVVRQRAVLTIDREYFNLTGGVARWLYRVVRRHAGHQPNGYRFDFRCLHAKSGSLAPLKDFALDIRQIVEQQSLPGYRLQVERRPDGREVLAFTAAPQRAVAPLVRQLALSMRVGNNL